MGKILDETGLAKLVNLTKADLSDAVTKSTEQEISATKTFTGNANVGFSSSTYGNKGNIYIEAEGTSPQYGDILSLETSNSSVSSSAKLQLFYNHRTDRKVLMPSTDSTTTKGFELGRETNQFFKLWLKGCITDNTYSITVAQIVGHTSNTDIHVLASDKTTWNNKQDAITSSTDISVGSITVNNSLNMADSTTANLQKTIIAASLTQYGGNCVLSDVNANTLSYANNPGEEEPIYIDVRTIINTKQDAITSSTDLSLNSLTASSKVYAPILESGINNIGNSGSTYTFTSITDKINTITLTADCTITLPAFDSTKSVTFMLKVTQDSTGGRNLTINTNGGTSAINLSEFDFSDGEANQKCWVTLLWDGTDVCFTTTKYVN